MYPARGRGCYPSSYKQRRDTRYRHACDRRPYSRRSGDRSPRPVLRQNERTVSGSTFTPSNLDSMSMEELTKLKSMIEEKQRLKSDAGTRHKNAVAIEQEKPWCLDKYTRETLNLKKFNGEINFDERIGQMTPSSSDQVFFARNDLLNTDLLFNYRRHFDKLPRTTIQDMIGARIFSMNNSPTLALVIAMAEEAATYMKYHSVHKLPFNPEDPIMSTITNLKHAVYAKVNMAKLTCVIGEDNYIKLRQLTDKPVDDQRLSHRTADLQRAHPNTFQSGILRCISMLVAFSRMVRSCRNRMLRTNRTQFVTDHDILKICNYYQCGLIEDLITRTLENHVCSDLMCKNRIKRVLRPHAPVLFFCPRICSEKLGLQVILKDRPSPKEEESPKDTDPEVLQDAAESRKVPETDAADKSDSETDRSVAEDNENTERQLSEGEYETDSDSDSNIKAVKSRDNFRRQASTSESSDDESESENNEIEEMETTGEKVPLNESDQSDVQQMDLDYDEDTNESDESCSEDSD